jgi:hypothetical protein
MDMKIQNENVSHVGLFWFNRDYKNFNLQVGSVKVYDSDITMGKIDIYPNDIHKKYRNNIYVLPRGRVELIHGKFKITVGLECPDEAISFVKKSYGIENFDVEVYRNSNWDMK